MSNAAEEISGEKLFEDVERQMIAWSGTFEPDDNHTLRGSERRWSEGTS